MGKDCTDDMITSSANQQMKHLSQLMKRAKERKKEQVFVVEGIKMFQEAPADTGKKGDKVAVFGAVYRADGSRFRIDEMIEIRR